MYPKQISSVRLCTRCVQEPERQLEQSKKSFIITFYYEKVPIFATSVIFQNTDQSKQSPPIGHPYWSGIVV
jgi:hypothetical protein